MQPISRPFRPLAGTVIGAVSTFATSWTTQATQARTARLNAERTRRDELYSRFLEEIARLYAHAATEEKVDFSQLVGVYALRGRIMLQSSAAVVDCASQAIKMVEAVYLAPNRADADVLSFAETHDPMKPFADACRAELAALR